MKNPCNAGLTVQRLGDAVPWNPEPPRAGGAGVSANDEDLASAGHRHHVLTERLLPSWLTRRGMDAVLLVRRMVAFSSYGRGHGLDKRVGDGNLAALR